ncbi:hypothetical protein Poly41_67220 [Novipirellula artificiosorum]|uniref:Uncharacterized protein n=1 Tax=Novipirellula artificiosorum TaxID=2528016 RepID=A0A5C6CX97_9BACT|nr:hypothetical protein Poly41_67220 [Novipirellula artificiosorum]
MINELNSAIGTANLLTSTLRRAHHLENGHQLKPFQMNQRITMFSHVHQSLCGFFAAASIEAPFGSIRNIE